ncbi:MurR/RpiR family transcriptional regulator [Romboutsia weinsteinii]|uniref:MurR/RpiR family transcriptional regulator n=1 Tax=Romboutsia weinsteinii TaxID=2020949 RepID=A0A371J9K7_9FIRM|nr:MurR/RpiR family transcriptional regulator [Romboutsia weinsteinii]RDY29367.1 MurR/RpiR family transcriptional regulator [Romboutsia weinsteinii]
MKIEELINKHYSNLNQNDLHILKYILNNKKSCYNLGINALADKCNVSRTTVLRLAQKLGLSGYSEFKVFLKWEERESCENDSGYVEALSGGIDKTIKHNKDKQLRDICELIYKKERIFIYTTGRAQQICAEELKRMFLFTHKYFNLISGVPELEALIPNLTSRDLVIIISFSGNTPNLDSHVNQLVVRGIDFVSMTRLDNNKLASMTPYNLYGVSSSMRLKSGVLYESTMFFYTISEVLFYHYNQYLKELEEKAVEIGG